MDGLNMATKTKESRDYLQLKEIFPQADPVSETFHTRGFIGKVAEISKSTQWELLQVSKDSRPSCTGHVGNIARLYLADRGCYG